MNRKAMITAGIILLSLLGWLLAQKFSIALPKPQSPEISQSQLGKPDAAVDSRLVAANTKFGFKLFSEILREDKGKNIFVSPTSVAIALSMTYNGASGKTQQAMAKTLELQGMSLEEVNQANQLLKASLENPDPNVQLRIANSLWAKQGIPFKPQFLQRNKRFYQAKVTDLDFGNPNSLGIINNWVKENTQGKIDSIINEIQPDQLLFLINAIYFKGNWTNKFDASQTANKPFYLADGSQKQHPMMSQKDEYQYYENDQFQAVSLPYGEGRVSLYVFLPKQKLTQEAFYQQLTTENWEEWMSQFRRRKGFVQLPRFKMEYDITLNEALKALGMEVAFSRDANFAQMSPTSVNINQVKHKTFVEVNEEGTEAAAVTSVGVMVTSAQMPEEPFQMIVNRPFFSCIRDNQTGTILFMGSIVEPQ